MHPCLNPWQSVSRYINKQISNTYNETTIELDILSTGVNNYYFLAKEFPFLELKYKFIKIIYIYTQYV